MSSNRFKRPLCLAVLLCTGIAACGDFERRPRGSDDSVRNDDPRTGPGPGYDGGDLLIAPSPISFEDAEFGQTLRQTVILENTGVDGAVVFSVDTTSGRGVEVVADVDLTPFAIKAGENREIEVEYTPLDCDGMAAELAIVWSHQEEPKARIPIYAPGLMSELVADRERIDFGRVGAARQSLRGLVLSNSGRCPATIESVRFEGSNSFQLVDQDGQPIEHLVVTREEPVQAFISYFSPVDVEARSTLILETFDPPQSVEVALTANVRQCPIAAGQGFVNDTGATGNDLVAIPLQSLTLSADDSFDPDGQIVSYEWTTIERPQDSSAPDGWRSSLAVVFLDLAGTYRFELDVVDNDGLSACEPSEVVVQVVPDEDLHVQLVWHTPNDADELDRDGSDVDLHLLRAPGSWFNSPRDCYYANEDPNWGEPGDSDDPSLDRDDIDGRGPENINLDNPQDDQVYSIGVHYFDDHGYGRSEATVRIYLSGTLVYEGSQWLE
ncbi:MAG: hypothetical protein KC561_02260, partial [Myxococcales bacterium]|nr:hypothetical protein [Myxococcales bacterium]